MYSDGPLNSLTVKLGEIAIVLTQSQSDSLGILRTRNSNEISKWSDDLSGVSNRHCPLNFSKSAYFSEERLFIGHSSSSLSLFWASNLEPQKVDQLKPLRKIASSKDCSDFMEFVHCHSLCFLCVHLIHFRFFSLISLICLRSWRERIFSSDKTVQTCSFCFWTRIWKKICTWSETVKKNIRKHSATKIIWECQVKLVSGLP